MSLYRTPLTSQWYKFREDVDIDELYWSVQNGNIEEMIEKDLEEDFDIQIHTT